MGKGLSELKRCKRRHFEFFIKESFQRMHEDIAISSCLSVKNLAKMLLLIFLLFQNLLWTVRSTYSGDNSILQSKTLMI